MNGAGPGGGTPPRGHAALAALGARLRDAGLTARGLAAWAGTARIAALPARLEALPPRSPTPAGAILALFVGGAEVARDRLQGPASRPPPALPRALPDALPDALLDVLPDALIAHELVEQDGHRLRARVAIVPLGQALLVCDRIDAPIERDLVCWPDDSSHHLATAIPPGRRADWLDLGCGSAFAALARPELASRIMGVDINERAVRYARLGAALSGIAHLDSAAGDVGTAREPAELVTCNAPMPAAEQRRSAAHPLAATLTEVWRQAEPGFFDRLWPALRRAVRPGGMIVVHGAREAVLPVLAAAAGERVVVTYTPESTRGFAIAWWRPEAPERFVDARRDLTPDRPHIEPRDRQDALAR